MIDLIRTVYYQNRNSKKLSGSEICSMVNDIGLYEENKKNKY